MTYARQTKRVRYEAPPVVESVFEARFEPSEVDWLVPGRFHEKVAHLLPVAESTGVDPKLFVPDERVRSAASCIKLLNDDRTVMCRIGPGVISVSALPPYKGFETLDEWIQKLWPHFCEAQPEMALKRLALCYVNQVSLPSSAEEFELRSLINLGFYLPEDALPQWAVEDFQLNLLLDFPLSRKLRSTLGTMQGIEPKLRFVLDCFAVQGLPARDEICGWVSVTHDMLGDAFERTVTEQLKSSFKPIPEDENS